ncbi:MAG: recombinase RecQ [Bacteroidetes bacterium GWA2_31_9]|nr:MAG: recombinase RecQ [Bacteroidetes bacterium GWA2_31_9]
MTLFREILLKYWGYSTFRPLQEDIIKSVYDGIDTLGLMPTGGGKSITFQVPALAKDGICLVVTPLIALMKDQVENLKKRGISAKAVYTGMTREELKITLDYCMYGDIKFLYLSPERIGTELFRNKVKGMDISLIAVDEAHCISQWGYDFRPSYLEIAKIREILPDVPILALTATATPNVVDDIQDKLQFPKKNVFRKSFERKNLNYIVRNVEDKLTHLLKIVENVKGTGVVYVRNRKKTKEISDFLNKHNISADYFHAGLDNNTRDLKQMNWKSGKCRIIVATNAFGMGIDKDDVRFVVHIDLPDSLEAYYQEAGRAGRDEKTAFGILLYNNSDKLKIEQRIVKTFPEPEIIKSIYSSLGNYYQIAVGFNQNMVFDFDIGDFAKYCHKDIFTIHSSLVILQSAGFLEVTDELNHPSKIHFVVNREDLYKFQVANRTMDGFIKLILRTYTGLFSDFVLIDEQFIAKKSKLDTRIVKDLLIQLAKQKIIHYIPQKRTPQVVFIEGRLEDKAIFLSKDVYKTRKEKYLIKIDAVIDYASTKSKCRSKILLEYFGEESHSRCGVCDVCRSRNELGLSKYEFDTILDAIKTSISSNPQNIDELMKHFLDNEEKAFKVIKWLIDTEKISNVDGVLVWN